MPLVWTLLLNGTLGLAAYWCARHALRIPAGLPRVLAAATLAWVWATVGMEMLGIAGFLTYRALLAWTVAGLVNAAVLRGRDRAAGAPVESPPPGPSLVKDEAWEVSAVVALGLVLWAITVHGLNSLLGPVKVVSDGPIYHLYFAARWWKAERLLVVAAPFGESVVSYFPAVGDLWFTWLLAGWGGERLAKVGQLPFYLAAALAAYGSARRVGAGVSAAAIAVCWFAAIFPYLLFTVEANVDTIFVAAYLVAAYFFLRFALGDEPRASLVLGGLALGGVLGTKPTGFVFGGLLLGAAAVAVWLRRSSLRQALGQLVLVGLLPLVMAGSWYGQNIGRTGNPLYPLHLQALGRVWLAGWYGSDAMSLSPYYLPMADWRALADILLAVFDARLFPIWAAALAGAWCLGHRRPLLDPYVWAFSALAVANLAAYWIVVPYRTQQRFMFQAAGLMVIPLARLFDRRQWLRILATALLAIHLLTAQSWPFRPSDQDPPWDLTRVIPNTIPPLLIIPTLSKVSRRIVPDPEDIPWSIAIFLIGAGSFAAAWLWSRRGRWARASAVLATLALVALAIAAADPIHTDKRAAFYPFFREYYRGWIRLESWAGTEGARIAYAGTNLPYFLLGTGLRNEVRYVNVDAHRDWLMHDYHHAAQLRGKPTWPSPWPAWDRLHPDYNAWLGNLRAEGIDLLVVASMGRPRDSLLDADPQGFPIERGWAEAHPETFEPLYGVHERDPKFRIYRVRPEVD
jgi:hypothetical protein